MRYGNDNPIKTKSKFFFELNVLPKKKPLLVKMELEFL